MTDIKRRRKRSKLRVKAEEIDYKNVELLKSQLAMMEEDDYFQSPSIAYKLQQQQWASDLYWKGQTQPMQIFNVMAWQKFIEYIREGKFKNPYKKKKEDQNTGMF